jgi:hypothetical protein
MDGSTTKLLYEPYSYKKRFQLNMDCIGTWVMSKSKKINLALNYLIYFVFRSKENIEKKMKKYLFLILIYLI